MNLNNISVFVFTFKAVISQFAENSIANKISNKIRKDELFKQTLLVVINCFYVENGSILLYNSKKNYDLFSALNQSHLMFSAINTNEENADVVFEQSSLPQNIYATYQTIEYKKNIPVNNFVIVISTTSSLLLALQKFRNSVWWNHEAKLLLINYKRRNSCIKARDFLHIVWSLNILSAIYLCQNLDKGTQIFTFNPFNHYAPEIWLIVKNLSNHNNKYASDTAWTLFQYSKNHVSNCENLYFDKTENLFGYTVKLGAVKSQLLTYDEKKSGLSQFGGVNGDICRVLWTKLNVTPAIKFYPSIIGSFSNNGTAVGFYKDILSQKIEFMMNMNFMHIFWKLQTYPYTSSRICLVSYKKSSTIFQSIIKFILIFPTMFWVNMAITFVIFVLIFKALLKGTMTSNVLELLRLFVGVCSLKQPSKSSDRFIFIYVIFVMMITNFYFQSILSSVSIVPQPNPVIVSLKALEESGVRIFGLDSLEQYVIPELKKRFEIEDISNCSARILRGEKVACVSGCVSASYNIYESDIIHISKKTRPVFLTFTVKEDWPLYSRINQIIGRINEAGLITLFRNYEEEKNTKKPHKTKKKYIVKLRNISFAMSILFIGIQLSVFTFILEIILKKLNKIFTYGIAFLIRIKMIRKLD